jgi:hypothetical protein
MKSANHRDDYAGHLIIICYEVEAVGIMRAISCLTVRGISELGRPQKRRLAFIRIVISGRMHKGAAEYHHGTLAVRMSIGGDPSELLHPSIAGAPKRIPDSNLNMIVDRYGLVQELMLYELVEQTNSENGQQLHDSVASLGCHASLNDVSTVQVFSMYI